MANYAVKVKKGAGANGLVGTAQIRFPIEDAGKKVGEFVVTGIFLRKAENGLRVQFPSRKTSEGEWVDTCFPVTADARKCLIRDIEAAYNAATV